MYFEPRAVTAAVNDATRGYYNDRLALLLGEFN